MLATQMTHTVRPAGMLSLARSAQRQPRLLLHTSAVLRAEGEKPPPTPNVPTHDSRTGARTPGSAAQHPGYTRADADVSSADPANMPSAEGYTRAGETSKASTQASEPHSGVYDMAQGAKIGGEGAVTPEERNTKNWGPNQKMPEFNELEGKRNPIRDGGSNEGGHDAQGRSKT